MIFLPKYVINPCYVSSRWAHSKSLHGLFGRQRRKNFKNRLDIVQNIRHVVSTFVLLSLAEGVKDAWWETNFSQSVYSVDSTEGVTITELTLKAKLIILFISRFWRKDFLLLSGKPKKSLLRPSSWKCKWYRLKRSIHNRLYLFKMKKKNLKEL